MRALRNPSAETDPRRTIPFVPESERELPSEHAPKSRWITIAILTVLWQMMLLKLGSDIRPAAPKERVTVNTVDPAKLAAIRKQWRQRALLLSKDKNTSAKVPENARYDSDRNRVVEKEQRAARTDVLPDPNQGRSGRNGETKPRARPQPKSPPVAGNIPLSKLGALANIGKTRPKAAEAEEEQVRRGPTGAGVDQALIDEQLPVGAENMLNTRESVYYTFYARIYEAIGPIWRSRIREQLSMSRKLAPGKYNTLVEVTLDREGNFVGPVRYVQRSGVDEFDRIVEESWEKSPTFRNPPKDLVGEDGTVRMGWNFVVEVQEGAGFQIANPDRVY